MGLLACVYIFLHKYTRSNDLIVGTPIAGREHPDLESQIGFYVNTVALRILLNEKKGFSEVLKATRDLTLEAYEHQQYPFDDLVSELSLSRDLSRNALFDVMVVLQNNDVNRIKEKEIRNVKIEKYRECENKTSKFDLTFNFIEVSGEIGIGVVFNSDIFYRKTIESMLVHYVNILEEIVKDIDKPVSQIELLSKSERDVLLKEFNGSLISYSNELTIVDVFESQVSETPDALALSFGSSSLTYLQLNERANQLSRYLRNLGVKGDTLVPICIDRGIEMIVGILGILKAGGAYVPIDPDYPEERIRYILEDIGSDLVLSDCTSKIKFDVFYAGKIILLDEDWDIISTEGKSNLCISISSTNLAYVIYTSGSTGNPKGVLIEHVNVVRLFKNESSLFNFSKADVWTMFHSFCFDFSVWEMYGALFYGGRLVIVPKSTAQDSVLFSELLEREQVTVLNQTPSAFYALQDCIIDRYNSLAVKYVIFGGEALNPSKLKPWKAAYKDCQLINMYGITETTVHVTYHNLTEADINGNTSVIGKPIPTLRVYILNQDFQLSPIGVPGEIYVSGAGLARGYHKHSDLTAEKFIINPFSKEWDTRLYKTGDFGRWLSDGTIEFLGRSDNQVKINGYRIELGEIEHALTKLEGIKECVVLMEEINDEYKKLTAYYTSIFPIPNIALKEHLARRLPTYCLPSYFVRVASMPLTSNGKVDKKLLRSMPNLSLKKIRNRKPHTSIEIKIASIWQDVLNVDVHTNDTFFNLGGNSISVIKAMHLIHAQIGVKLTIKDFFDCNLQQLAKKCEKHSNI
jgi:amino acid adenylation domain-containing protein